MIRCDQMREKGIDGFLFFFCFSRRKEGRKGGSEGGWVDGWIVCGLRFGWVGMRVGVMKL